MAHTFAGISTHGPYAGIGISGRISRRRSTPAAAAIAPFVILLLVWLAVTAPIWAPVLFFRARKANAPSPEAYAAQLAVFNARLAKMTGR